MASGPTDSHLQRRSATTAVADAMKSNSTNRQDSSNRQPQNPSSGRKAASEPSTSNSSALGVARSALQSSMTARRSAGRDPVREMQQHMERLDFGRLQTRRWKAGDVYAPHDLSGVEMSKWRQTRRKATSKRVAGGGDAIDQLGINPIEHYKNFGVMTEYMSEMGRIKNRSETGLRPVNQRRMAKAIRRAVGIGLIPSVHQHPEILRLSRARRSTT